MPNPPNNNDLQREKVRFLNNSLSLQRVIMQGSIANSSRDNVVVPAIPSTPPPPVSPTLTPSITPTETPPVSPTPTETPPVSPTPTASVTPTPSITPSISLNPSITPTITVTPSVTPNYSYITLQPLTGLGQDVYIGGITEESQYLPSYNFKDINGLYRAISYNLRSGGGVFTVLKKYQNNSYTSNLIGASALDSPFNWIYEITNEVNPIYPFISPTDLGNTALIPFSGYLSNDISAPYNVISGVKVYPDYKFSSFFARTSAVSAIIVRGLTGTAFNDTLSTVNGMVLNKELYYGDIIQYEGYNSYYQVLLYYAVDIFANNYWILEITPYDAYNTYIIGFSGAIGSSTQLPFTGLKMIGDYLANETNFAILSGQINQPDLQLLQANELYKNYPTPTPTPTITITPSVTPTISLTPTITPTVTKTPTTTPTITPTISITPSITPTISVTPTITITVTPTKATPTPTPTTRTDTLPFSSVYLSAFGFYGNMEGVDYGIDYDFNAPVLLKKQAPPYDWVWLTYYEPYNCNVSLYNSPIQNVWYLNLEQGGEYGFGGWNVATTTQSRSAIPLKNWTLSPGSSGGIIILNG